jgi:uncharacterized membrane protein
VSDRLRPPEQAGARLARLDALRGLAVLWMTAFHFSFDLAHFGLTQQNFYSDPVWLWQRTAILSLFLFCAGLGQSLAVINGQSWLRFWQRWLQIAGCAALVSAGSYLMFPNSWIYFGVLHGMAVMLLIARLTARWGTWLWRGALVAILLAQLAPWLHLNWAVAPRLDTPAWHWLGLMSHKPFTEDYVPLLPWLGVMWLGVALGPWVHARGWLTGALPAHRATAAITFIGRWSLSWYLLHQPVLIGVLMAVMVLR